VSFIAQPAVSITVPVARPHSTRRKVTPQFFFAEGSRLPVGVKRGRWMIDIYFGFDKGRHSVHGSVSE
jgi:hypothetical protein